jgi:hypothetical protein
MNLKITPILTLLIGAVTLLGHSAPAQSPENKAAKVDTKAPLLEKKVLSLAAARKMAGAAINEAEKNHWSGVVAIVDDGGWLILLERMDAAMTPSVEPSRRQGADGGVIQKAEPGAGRLDQPRMLRGHHSARLRRNARRAPGDGRWRSRRCHRREFRYA